MNKNRLLSTMTLALTIAIGSNVIIPALSVSAKEKINENAITYNQEIKEGTSITVEEFKNATSIEILDEDTILINEKSYDFAYVAGVLCNEIDLTTPNTKSAASVTIKKAAKWVVTNWTKIYNKIPDSMKKYFKLDGFISVMDQFIGISDSVEDFFHNCFREMGMPESVNWAITNVIMLLLPI